MINEQDMENINENEKSDHNLITTETLEDIHDGNQTHPTVNKREAGCKYVIVLRKKIRFEEER